MIDIFVTKDILNEPIINMFAIIGGNISFFAEIRSITSKILLTILSYCDVRETKRRLSESEES